MSAQDGSTAASRDTAANVPGAGAPNAGAPPCGPASHRAGVLRVRPATAADAPAIARLSAELGYPAVEAAMAARVARILADPAHRY